jgi:hypothetical protein
MALSTKRKKLKRLLDKLSSPAKLNPHAGRLIPTKNPISEKDRKHDGMMSPRIHHPKMKWKDVHALALSPEEQKNPWSRYDDGLRDLRRVWNLKYFTMRKI